MALKLVKIDKDTQYQEWLDFRNNGIGASEVGSIMGLNPWKSSIELYYQKLGIIPQKMEENMAMFMGNLLEDHVAEMWEHWEGDSAGMIGNYRSNRVFRRALRVPGYIVNSDFPNLFFSPDRLMLPSDHSKRGVFYKHHVNLEAVTGVLEIKTISGWAAKQWDGGIPPSYVMQLMTYMLGLGLEYGELASLQDGRDMSVLPIEFNPDLAEEIIIQTDDFWNRVLKGREALLNGGNPDEFVPPPDGTEAYAAFLNKRYEVDDTKIAPPDPKLLESARQALSIADQIKQLEYEKTELENNIKLSIGDCYMVDFGDAGKITWRADKNGKRTFRNLVK